MIFKLLVFGVVIFIVYTLFFKSSRGEVKHSKNRGKRDDSDTMIECSKCSVFVSESEAIIKDGKFYCSKECAGVK